MRFFGSMRVKILLALVVAGLLPHMVTAALFFIRARGIIEADRVEIYLKHVAQQAADKIDLILTERRAEVDGLAAGDRFEALAGPPEAIDLRRLEDVLDEKVRTFQVYDLLVLADPAGRIVAVNPTGRFGNRFDRRICDEIEASELRDFPEEQAAFEAALRNGTAVTDFYASRLVNTFYDFDREDQSRSFHLGLASVVRNRSDGRPVGVLLALMNWEFIQGNLDLAESDFRKFGLKSGYLLLLDRTGSRFLATPFRKNRPGVTAAPALGEALPPSMAAAVRTALARKADTLEYPVDGRLRYGSLCRSSLPAFGWLLMVSLTADEIFAPVSRLSLDFTLIGGAALLLILATAVFLSRNLSRPLRRLSDSARRLSRGEHHHRAEIRSGGEIGELAGAFNTMAATIEERQGQLEEANRRLEEKVRERTRALEESNAELRQALDNLREAQDQLVRNEKMASLGRLVAGIAHEIKNPLNFIYGNTGFLCEYADAVRDYAAFVESQAGRGDVGVAAIRRYAEDRNIPFMLEDLLNIARNINEGAERIRSIVDDLRSFSRAPAGTRQPVDLRKALDMCLNLLRNQYKQRIRLVRDYREVPDVNVYAGKIEQVFLNLIGNAVQAIEGEGEIRLSIRREGEWVVVEVADSGKGIPPEHLHKIFEPFFTTKEVGQGTGLGLSISFNIVRQHGGRLSARNLPEGGAVFRVELPVQEPPENGGEGPGDAPRTDGETEPPDGE